jgi:small subunit ribosomal protein S6
MPNYECVFIARNDVTQQQVETIAEQMAGVLGEQGGEVKKREYWGLRGLAYRIKKNRRGHYMLLGVSAPPAAMQEIERQLGLNEDVLRSLTIRVEQIEEGPSAILAKRGEERDRDRGFRGPRPAGRFSSGRGGGGGRDRSGDREEFRARPREELDPAPAAGTEE